MSGRDPAESHRVSTPLELFFDLTFVVAVAAAAAGLHHDLSAGHVASLASYLMVFFAIWWAWVNYTWFANAYDSNDILFRLMTFVIMAGVLVLAAGVPRAMSGAQDYKIVTLGYAIMRAALVPLWWRVVNHTSLKRPFGPQNRWPWPGRALPLRSRCADRPVRDPRPETTKSRDIGIPDARGITVLRDAMLVRYFAPMASFPDPDDEPPSITNRTKVLTLAVVAVVLALLCWYGISFFEHLTLWTDIDAD